MVRGVWGSNLGGSPLLNALRAPEVVTGHGLRLTVEGPPRPEKGWTGVSTVVLALVADVDAVEGGWEVVVSAHVMLS